MTYILDTNICIHMLKEKSFSILKHAKKSQHTTIYLSAITESELWFGVANSSKVSENTEILEAFLECFPKLPFDSSFSRTVGFLKVDQKKSGKNIGNNDLFLAAQALELDAILVTNNDKEFKQIKELRTENWLRAK